MFDESRRTVRDNANREGVKYTRHASMNACGFCRMLATRVLTRSEPGAPGLYVSRATARRNAHRFDDVRGHDSCKCVVVAVRSGYEPPSYVHDWVDDYYAVSRSEDGTLRPEWNIAYRMERRADERAGGGARNTGPGRAAPGNTGASNAAPVEDVINLDSPTRDAGGQFVGNRELFQRNSARAAEIAKSARDQVATVKQITTRVDSYVSTASQVTSNVKRVTDIADKAVGFAVPVVRDIKRAVDAADKATSSAAAVTGGVNRTVTLVDKTIRDTERIAQGAKELADDVKSIVDDAAYITAGIKQLFSEAGDITDITAATGLRGKALATAGKAGQLTDQGLDLIGRAKGAVETAQNYPAKVADIPNVLRAPLLDAEKLVRSAQANATAAHQAAVDASDLADALRSLVDNVIDYRRNGFTETYNRTAAWVYSERVTDELGNIIGGRIATPKPIGSVTPPTWVTSERLELPAPPRRLEITAGAPPVSQVDDAVAAATAAKPGPVDNAKGITTELPTDEAASYFHSIITRDDITDAFVNDIKSRGVQKPIEIVTDGTKAAIADGHHRTLAALEAGSETIPVTIYRVSPEAMMGGRGDKVGDSLAAILKPDATAPPTAVKPRKTPKPPVRSFDEVEADFNAAVTSGADDAVIDRLADEMITAEAAEKRLAANRARAQARKDAANSAKSERMSQLIEDGLDPVEAEALAFGISPATVASRGILYEARSNGYHVKSVEDYVRQVFREKAAEAFFAAEDATNGYMLKRKYTGKIDPADLWTCTDKQARAWMSDEMAAWFDTNGRITRDAVRTMITEGTFKKNPMAEDFLQ